MSAAVVLESVTIPPEPEPEPERVRVRVWPGLGTAKRETIP